IASGGDNLDYAAAEDCGIRVLRAMSLPGKIAPRSAAEYIRNTLYQYLK
ncbi:MAG TPA: dipicolinate synthase subunit DpsA, partial [Clostridiales bacterium]|nr:dipicolinate synthase subunit DpsA [Clostridiales bacterium]